MMQITGWAIIHSIWQGVLIAGALGVFLWVARYASSQLRYLASLIALTLSLALPVVTAMRQTNETKAAKQIGTARFSSGSISVTDGIILNDRGTSDLAKKAAAIAADFQSPSSEPVATTTSSPAATTDWRSTIANTAGRAAVSLQPFLQWLVLAWLLGLIALSARLLGGLIRTRQLTTTNALPASDRLRAEVARVAARLRVSQPVRVVESTRIAVPLVIGSLRPVVVFPVSLLTGLAPWQLEMLLAHELAHVRRYDYLVNLTQTVIETMLFYHPAVRWISSRVREERENCCDDLAVTACGGDRARYSKALLALEETRDDGFLFAAAATGTGSLVRRISRLLGGTPDHVSGSRWIAGVITIAAALFAGRQAVGMTAQRVPGLSAITKASFFAPPDTIEDKYTADPRRAAPDTVIRIATGSLADRVRAAADRAGSLGARRYWIGYLVAGDPAGRELFHFDRYVSIRGEGMTFSGHTRFGGGGISNFHFDGAPLEPLVGRHSAISTAIFILAEGRPSPRPVRLHLGSFTFPAYFDRMPLIWLDSVADVESIELLRAMESRSSSVDLKQDLIAAIGAHNSSASAVPVLVDALASSRLKDVRQEAAEWLARHATPQAVSALSRAVRTDPDYDVREEAIEAFEDMRIGAATDTLMSFSRTLPDTKFRAEAVESLGHREEARVAQFLDQVARGNDDYNVREEAVEALGEMPAALGFSALVNIARTARESEIRAKAVEAIGEAENSAEALRVLRGFASQSNDSYVAKAAIEAIADIDNPAAISALDAIISSHPDEALRVEAVEALSDASTPQKAFESLSRIAGTQRSSAVRRKAVEAMGQIDDPRSVASLVRMIEEGDDESVQVEAAEALGETHYQSEAISALARLARTHRSYAVRKKAIESLSELDGSQARAALESLARSDIGVELRKDAIEAYAENAGASASVPFLRSLLSDASESVRISALETLAELDDIGYDALADIARTTKDSMIRAKVRELLEDR